jgi:predicted dehydrogenase
MCATYMSTSVGIVGAGNRGRSHVQCFHRIAQQDFFRCDSDRNHPHNVYPAHGESVSEWVEDIGDLQPRITAIADPSEQAREGARAYLDEIGAPAPTFYASVDDMLRETTIDAAVIASPNDTHLEALEALTARDVDVLCDKPLATTLADHDAIEELIADSESHFQAGFNLRSHPKYTRIQERIADGDLGRVGTITATNVRKPFPLGFRYSQSRSGGALLEKNCHDFDLFNWYFDDRPVSVTAVGGQHVFDRDSDIVDHATVIVEYAGGHHATLELCLYAPFTNEREAHRQYQIRGSEGVLRQDETIRIYDRDTVQTIEHESVYGGHGGADLYQTKNFLRSRAGDATPPATLDDARRAAAVALAAEEAIETDGAVDVDVH